MLTPGRWRRGRLPRASRFDIEAAFPTMCRQSLRMATWAAALTLRVIAALYPYNSLLWRGTSIRHIVTAKSGVAQWCPFSGCLFVLAADSVVRAMRAVTGARARMVPRCADDVAALLRGFSQVPWVAPVIRAAEQAARLKLKASKCVLVPMAPMAADGVAPA